MAIMGMPDGREWDLEDDAQVGALGRYILALEESVRALRADVERMGTLVQAAINKPLPDAPTVMVDNKEVVGELRLLRAEVRGGSDRIVEAQLADTVLKRDPVTGAAESSRKVIR